MLFSCKSEDWIAESERREFLYLPVSKDELHGKSMGQYRRESMLLYKVVLWCTHRTQKCQSITSSWMSFPTPWGSASLLSVSMTSTKALKVLNTFFLSEYLSSNLQRKFCQAPQESNIKEPNIPCPHPRTTWTDPSWCQLSSQSVIKE